MKFPSFCPLSIRLLFGFRSFAVAFCTFALLGSGEARAEDSFDSEFFAFDESDPAVASAVTNLAVVLATRSSASVTATEDDILAYVRAIYNILNTSKTGNFIGTVPRANSSSGSTLGAYLGWGMYDNFPGLSASPSAIKDTAYLKIIRDELAVITNGWGYRTADTLHQQMDSVEYYLQSLWGNVPTMESRSDSHGNELLVAAPDLESLLDDLYAFQSYNLGGMYGLMQYINDNGLLVHGNITVSGGQVSVSNQVDVNVLNWPDYFTGEYDQDVAEEITSAPSYESDWDSYVADTTDYAEDSEDDASPDSPYFSDVTNAVDSVVLDTDDQDESLRIRDEVFNPISDDLLPASVVNRNFSSDVLILPAVPQFHIPEIAWDGNDSAWQSFLTRSGSLMSSLYDVFYAIFVIWLIWREYNFYFRTM